MELNKVKKLCGHIFRLLKVNEIVIPLGRTNKGNLGLKFTANTDDFEVMLDAVPLSTKDMLNDDNNIELKGLLIKYLFGEEKTDQQSWAEQKVKLEITNPSKKRGRPKKSV